jgi:hypothetical protein
MIKQRLRFAFCPCDYHHNMRELSRMTPEDNASWLIDNAPDLAEELFDNIRYGEDASYQLGWFSSKASARLFGRCR